MKKTILFSTMLLAALLLTDVADFVQAQGKSKKIDLTSKYEAGMIFERVAVNEFFGVDLEGSKTIDSNLSITAIGTITRIKSLTTKNTPKICRTGLQFLRNGEEIADFEEQWVEAEYSEKMRRLSHVALLCRYQTL